MAVTLTLEDGTGLTNSNAYADRTSADQYHEEQGHTDWAALSTAARDAALIQATRFIDRVYGTKFLGIPLDDDQALEWPRDSAYDRYDRALEEIPTKLAQATAELALAASRRGELQPSPLGPTEALATGEQGGAASIGSVKKSRVVVGPIEKELEYTVGQFQESYPTTASLLKGLLIGGGVRRAIR